MNNKPKNTMLASRLQRYLSEIINNELMDELASQAIITEIQVSNDNSVATIYVDFLNEKQKSIQHLNNAKSYLKKRLSSYLTTRRIPELNFVIDNQLEKLEKIEKLIEESKK